MIFPPSNSQPFLTCSSGLFPKCCLIINSHLRSKLVPRITPPSLNSDKEIRLFESQYHVPNGISYNSYLIKDEKNVVMDTVDRRATSTWLENLERELNGETITVNNDKKYKIEEFEKEVINWQTK